MPYLISVLGIDPAETVSSPPTGQEETGTGDTVDSVIELSRRDVVDRRGFVAASSAYALAALGLPDPDAVLRRVRLKSGGKVQVGRGEVAAIRQMTKSLGDAAAELGGGHARHLAVRYLHDDVAPWLDGTWSEAVGRQLFAATAQLVHLAGWMAQDEGNQDAAQQYYAHSFRLASEAGDAELAATALRGLAVQAPPHPRNRPRRPWHRPPPPGRHRRRSRVLERLPRLRGRIRSIKVQDAVNDMRARLYRLRDVPGVEELDERASALE
ncbi:hypothetical protein ACH4E7_24005 [Kitasatospora sp. NPDC018058]|uniref:hypothetical protein n=1 Tax=Kitasatospora sp. NPDC018058 TaxID=3364025 RepID=UPI0037BEEFE4